MLTPPTKITTQIIKKKFKNKCGYFHSAAYLKDLVYSSDRESKLFREKVKKDLDRAMGVLKGDGVPEVPLNA